VFDDVHFECRDYRLVQDARAGRSDVSEEMIGERAAF
jgi:hypothetical protein